MEHSRTEKLSVWIIGAGIAAGLACAGYFVRSGIVRFKAMEQKVAVRGLAERIVESDEASWVISYSAAANEMTELNQRVQSTQKAFVEFLKKQRIPEDEIAKQPVEVTDRLAADYGNTKGIRFTARGQIIIASRNVSRLKEASQRTDELVRAGVIFTNSTLRYYFTSLNSIKPAMLEEATKNAREAATRFAETAGTHVGRIKRATQGLFSIDSPHDSYDNGTSQKKKVRVVTEVEFYLE